MINEIANDCSLFKSGDDSFLLDCKTKAPLIFLVFIDTWRALSTHAGPCQARVDHS